MVIDMCCHLHQEEHIRVCQRNGHLSIFNVPLKESDRKVSMFELK